jgi:hypothetical protein
MNTAVVALDVSFVNSLVEEYWDKDCYLNIADTTAVEEEGLSELWKDAYFDDMVERYCGTCNFLLGKDEKFLEDFNMYQAFDNQIFNCATCGWWYEAGEQGESENEEIICNECAEGDEK